MSPFHEILKAHKGSKEEELRLSIFVDYVYKIEDF